MILALLLCLLLCCALSKEVEVDLTIPWPSGIMVDRLADPHSHSQRIYRFGRLQHSAISLRPQWAGIHALEGVLSREQAADLIQRAEAHAAQHGWIKGRHVDYAIRPTKDLPVRVLYPDEADWAALQQRLFYVLTALGEQFALSVPLLRIDDLFITKYDSASAAESKLDPHTDKSPWSFVLALNDGFEGGGTFFVQSQDLYRPPVGGAVIFNGKQLHGAFPATAGSRYIVAGFCEYDEQFMSQYDPLYDGHAASSGFRTGDLIVGIEECVYHAGRDCSSCAEGQGVSRRMAQVEDVSDDEWVRLAQSCETLCPGEPTVLRVRRMVRDQQDL